MKGLHLKKQALILYHLLIITHTHNSLINNPPQLDNGTLIVIWVIIVDFKLERLWSEKFILKKIAVIVNKLWLESFLSE